MGFLLFKVEKHWKKISCFGSQWHGGTEPISWKTQAGRSISVETNFLFLRIWKEISKRKLRDLTLRVT